jgi:hypothetical protein
MAAVSVRIVVLASTLSAASAQAALIVTPGASAGDLVSTLLAGTSGINVSNAQFVGASVQNGSFTGGTSAGLGFNTGIVLSTGRTTDLPLASKGAGVGANEDLGRPGDAKLDTIVSPRTTNDAAVLKFDFIPNGDTVKFSYVFGSTEYNDFVNSQFNDVFAFYVNGVNRALVPGTSTPVAINNVNCGGPTTVPPGANPSHCDLFVNNRNQDATVGANALVNLGGLTKTLGFTAPVNPGVTNTMYLAIADTSDLILDSAVFLAGGTFTSCGGAGQPPCTQPPPPPPPPPGTVAEPHAVGLLALLAATFGFAARRRPPVRSKMA